MRYTVKILKEGVITDDLNTDSYVKACKHESYAIAALGKDRVWICDNLQEIMVG